MNKHKNAAGAARLLWLLFGVLVFTASGMYTAGAAQSAPLVLTVVPRQPAAVTHRNWIPLTQRLAREIGHPVELKVFNVFSEFEDFTYAGRADLMFINPYQQVMLNKRIGAIPLVRDDSTQLSGALVVRADDSMQSLKELEGQTIAFPHPNSFGASLYMRALLTEEYGIRFKPVYVSSHGNVYRSVINGKAKAGGGINVTLNKEAASVQEKLRIIYETPGVAPHPLSAHPRVASELRERIVQAFFRMANDREGSEMLRTVTLTSPVRADYARDYQVLERLHLDRYYEITSMPEN